MKKVLLLFVCFAFYFYLFCDNKEGVSDLLLPFCNTTKLTYSLCPIAYKLKDLFGNNIFNTDL
jgi:hypothetical protein